MIKTNWVNTSLAFFLFIAIIGVMMRVIPFSNSLFNYQHLLHTHSHVAFQGWVYTSLLLLFSKLYLDEELINQGKYKTQFQLTIIVIIGILFSFLLQGYALFSILFSSLFQILNYWFAYRFLKDVSTSKKAKKHTFSLKFIKVSFWMLILSTIGPWIVGFLSAKGLGGTEYFNSALYFFLHFQYNGFFSFAIIGLIFWLIEHYSLSFNRKYAQLFFILFSISVIPSYTLSLLGMSYRGYILVFGYIAALLQLIALIFFFLSLKNVYIGIKTHFNFWSTLFFKVTLFSFALKITLQFMSVLPFLEALAFGNRFLIIAYIHLIMLGFISPSLILLFYQLKWLNHSLLSKIGFVIFLIGFIMSELILFFLGLEIDFPNKQFWLLIFSVLISIGILLILSNNFLLYKKSRTTI